MKGNVKNGFLNLHLHNKSVSLRCRELQDETIVFDGGAIKIDPLSDCVLGGIVLNERKLFFSGDSLKEFEVTTRVYSPVTIPPYRGYRVDDTIAKARLYEPVIVEFPIDHVIRGWTYQFGIFYRIEEGDHKFFKLIPVSHEKITKWTT